MIPVDDLKGLLPAQMRQLAQDLGEPAYRGDQLFGWLHEHQQADFEGMTNLPERFRQALRASGAAAPPLRLLERCASTTGKAVKFLFDLDGGRRSVNSGANSDDSGQIEAVLIIDGDRRTACLSSQVGCALDCKFCATAKMGFLRNLRAGQIVEQLHQLHLEAQSQGERLTNIVMMGMGEPLLNYDNVTRALKLARLQQGPSIGGRKITVSTAGHVPGILRLSQDDLNVGLAISLNATDDETRSRLMPINRRWPIAELLASAQTYFDCKGRRVTFEYVLLEGVTDAEEDAVRLAAITAPIPCKINLLPYNELAPGVGGEGERFRRPSAAQIHRFTRRVTLASPHAVTLRDSRGRDIDAACGQLHHRIIHPGAGQSSTPPVSV